jgi:hypothetical protein
MHTDLGAARPLAIVAVIACWLGCSQPHILSNSREDAGPVADAEADGGRPMDGSAADGGEPDGALDGASELDGGGELLGLRLVPPIIARGVPSTVRVERTSDDLAERVLAYESRLPVEFAEYAYGPALDAVTIPAGETAVDLWLMVSWPADASDSRLVTTESISFSEIIDARAVTTPVPFELRASASQVVQGSGTTCVLVEGRVQCMGENANGMAGSKPESRLQTFEAPHRTAHWTTHRFSKLSMERTFACGIEAESGAVWCWGQENDGALTLTSLESGVTDLDVGEGHACAIRGHQVYCWGRNDKQQVAAGAPVVAEVTRIDGLPEYMTRVAVGADFSCAMTDLPNDVYCWGANDVGQLGRGTSGEPDPVATRIDTSAAFDFHYELTLAAAGRSACIISSGDVYCWGEVAGSSAPAGFITKPMLTVRNFGLPFTTLSMSKLSACATSGSGAVCWGKNTWGSLQVDRQQDPAAPSIVQGFPEGEVTELSSGGYRAPSHCAIVDGLPWCWGFHPSGELGIDARLGNVLRPKSSPLLNAHDFSELRLNGYSDLDGVSCFLAEPDRALHCWGWGSMGQLASSQGVVPFYHLWSEPTPRTGAGILDFDIGQTFMLTASLESVTTYGSAGAGELGNGELAGQHTPGTRVDFGNSWLDASVTQVSAGSGHACAVVTDGERGLYCWGSNFWHQLGVPSIEHAATRPVQVIAGPVSDVATSAEGTCAVVGGKVQCWGDREVESPRDISAASPLPQFVEVVTYGRLRGCARSKYQAESLNQRGELWCWEGAELRAERVGDGFMDIDASGVHACGLKAGAARDELHCWGDNHFGQLGAGDRDEHFQPVMVEQLVGSVRRFECSGGLRPSTCAEDEEGWKCWGNNTRRQFEVAPWVSPPTRMLPWD